MPLRGPVVIFYSQFYASRCEVSPSNGADDRGPTASLHAAAAVGGVHVGNGLAVNESLDPQFARGSRGAAIVEALTRGYFAAGGMQVQYNVVDVDELIDAKLHPERHRGLVVRISGYSAYFNDLTPAMQDELIARSQHGRPACQIVPPAPAAGAREGGDA